MKINPLFWCLLFSASLLTALRTDAQNGWERQYKLGGGSEKVLALPDGGFLAISWIVSQSNGTGLRFFKTDQNGVLLWTKDHILGANPTQNSLLGLVLHPNGFVYATLSVLNQSNDTELKLLKLNSSGDLVWQQTLFTDFQPNPIDLKLNGNGKMLLVGRLILQNQHWFAAQIDSDGNKEWERNFTIGSDFLWVRDATGTANGQWLVAGGGLSGGEIFRLDATTGSILEKMESPGPNDTMVLAVDSDASGNLACLVQSASASSDGRWVRIMKLQAGNAVAWDQLLPDIKPHNGTVLPHYQVEFAASGSQIIAGLLDIDTSTLVLGTVAQQPMLFKFDQNGQLLKSRKYGPFPDINSFFHFKPLPDGGVIMGAHYYNTFRDILVRTDSDLETFTSHISGTLYDDENQNCLPDFQADGRLPKGTIVRVDPTSSSVKMMTVADANGWFDLVADTGQYEIIVPNLGPYHAICDAPVLVSIDSMLQLDTSHVVVENLVDCPLMTVDLGTVGLRHCFASDYRVQFCNNGTTVGENARIEIVLPDGLDLNSASQPFIQTGDTLIFQLGDVEPFKCGTFFLNVTPDCDMDLLGKTLCVEAHIYPDSFCLPIDPQWSGASLEIDAFCSSLDSVKFRVKNRSTADMAQPHEFIVIEDHIIIRMAPLQLPGGADTTFAFAGNGRFFRGEIDQEAFHPGFSMPAASVEGCGGFVSQGFVQQFPQDDADYFLEIDCQEVVGSFDPNDKAGFPLGVGNEKWIVRGQELEYLIRFQNTGTADAINVLVRDTLPSWLDPGTMVAGASSHDYQFSLSGNGVAEFYFNNIHLPDSNSNEPASHGFVKFRIKQLSGLADGTEIENRAAIFFDFNAPVITNWTRHVIGDYLQNLPVSISEIAESGTSAVPLAIASPNPADERADIFFSEEMVFKEGRLGLYFPDGRLASESFFSRNRPVAHRRELPPGLYFFKVFEKEKAVASGKLIFR